MERQTDQGKASLELKDWLTSRQRQLRVTKSTRAPCGQTLDWIPIESQTSEKLARSLPSYLFNAGLGNYAEWESLIGRTP